MIFGHGISQLISFHCVGIPEKGFGSIKGWLVLDQADVKNSPNPKTEGADVY